MAQTAWNDQIAALPQPHILQTQQWADLKKAYGWQSLPQTWRDAHSQPWGAAMVLSRTATLGLRVLYAPRGPLLDWSNPQRRAEALDALQKLAKKQGAIMLKMDPEVILGTGIPGTPEAVEDPVGQAVQAELTGRGWRLSDGQVQFRNTVWLDLNGTEDDWLARMKPKARYNLRLAERKGVTIRTATPADYPLLYHMYAETSVRDGFVIRPERYYSAAWQGFSAAGMAEALVAEVEGEAVSGLWLFHFAGRAWYLYGMSRPIHREKMPNYLLQWETMRRARAYGCTQYDLWGAPDVFDESDSMWGVFRFKEGLGGTVVRTLGAWDYTARPQLYTFYTRLLPRLLNWMRRRGKEKTRQEVGA